MRNPREMSERRKTYWKTYCEANVRLEDKDIQILIGKVKRHFKLRLSTIRFWGNEYRRSAYAKLLPYGATMISISHRETLATIIHELGHIWQYKQIKYNYAERVRASRAHLHYHTKKFITITLRLFRYVFKMAEKGWNLATVRLVVKDGLITKENKSQ